MASMDGVLREAAAQQQGAERRLAFTGLPDMVCSPDMSHVFEKRLAEICGSIADVETRCSASEARAQSAELRAEESEAQVLEYADRLEDAETILDEAIPELTGLRARNLQLEQQVNELQEQLSQSHAACNGMLSLGALLDRERIEKARLQASVSTAKLDRDSALNDLASAYSDMQAMQAALLDSALYVRFLRAKLLEAQLAEHRSDGFGASCSAAAAPEAKAEPMAFSFEKTKTAIRTAIKEAAGLEKGERLKRVRQLRLRWHPDKNPELQEFACEVTKIINEAVEEMEA